mmetsp:Transcript_95362/g.273458  ORF Transcript_95362/g.273458 Transcript_95362/m.273458 type:complete len:295 (-) Transcript_95362:244-1128(-)
MLEPQAATAHSSHRKSEERTGPLHRSAGCGRARARPQEASRRALAARSRRSRQYQRGARFRRSPPPQPTAASATEAPASPPAAAAAAAPSPPEVQMWAPPRRRFGRERHRARAAGRRPPRRRCGRERRRARATGRRPSRAPQSPPRTRGPGTAPAIPRPSPAPSDPRPLVLPGRPRRTKKRPRMTRAPTQERRRPNLCLARLEKLGVGSRHPRRGREKAAAWKVGAPRRRTRPHGRTRPAHSRPTARHSRGGSREDPRPARLRSWGRDRDLPSNAERAWTDPGCHCRCKMPQSP